MTLTFTDAHRSGRGATAGALRREGELLARCRHPGVVELRDIDDDGDAVTLVTRMPAGRPLADAALTPEEVAGLGAALATTLADLHDIGVAHGRVDVCAVHLADDGRPVLCDFSGATWLDGPPGAWTSHPAAAADDRALGRLLGALLARGRSPDPLPPLSPAPRRWRRGCGSDQLHRLVAAAGEGRLRARELAEALASRVPAARLPGTAPAADGEAVLTDGGRRHWTVGLAAGAVAVVTLLLLHGHDHGHHVPASASPTFTYQSGVLTFASAHYRVGQPGDVVTVGRWWCGQPAAALVQPSSGSVWAFRTWPAAGSRAVAVPVGRVPGARDVRALPAGRCDALAVTGADGSTVTFEPWRQR